MKIKYEFVDGTVDLDVEVNKEIEEFYLASIEEEKSSNRRNERTDRHTSFESFDYEDAEFFTAADNPSEEVIGEMEIERLLSCLNENQKFLVQHCIIEGVPYTEIARLKGKDESAIRHAVNRALKKIRKNFI